MKTLIELPDSLATRAKRVADTRGVSLDQLVIQGLESLVPPVMHPSRKIVPTSLTPAQEEYMEIDEYGVGVLKNRNGIEITNAMIRGLRDEDELGS